MSDVNGIDVEKIMDEIRSQIPETEEKWAELRFEDVPVDPAAGGRESAPGYFDINKFEESVAQTTELWPVAYYQEIEGAKWTVFPKKVVRKVIRFCVEPITQNVMNFHRAVMRALSSLRHFVADQLEWQSRTEAENQRLRRQIAELEERIAALEEKQP